MKRRFAAALVVCALSSPGADTAIVAGTAAGALDAAKSMLRGPEASPSTWPRAFAIFDSAARKGDPAAAYYLGLMYRNGMGVERNSRTAAQWLSFAAKRQVAPAMFIYANMLLTGEGVPRNERLARTWLEKAAELEHPEASMQVALGMRDGSMGFERNEALAEMQMKQAAHAMRHRAPEP